MYHFAAVEDDAATAETLARYVDRFAAAQGLPIRVTRFDRAEKLLSSLNTPYDLFLLDIQLPGMDGMEAARCLRRAGMQAPILFITSLAQYAVNGYEVDALDFMVKPVAYDPFALKLRKAIGVIDRQRGTVLPVSVDRAKRFVPTREIRYIEVVNHDLIIHTEQTDYRTRGSIAQVEQQLEGAFFVRISACFLVNMRFVTGMDARDIFLDGGQRLAMSRALKKDVQKKLTEYLGGLV